MVGHSAEMMVLTKDDQINWVIHLAEMLASLKKKDFWRADYSDHQKQKVGMRAGHLAEMMAEMWASLRWKEFQKADCLGKY